MADISKLVQQEENKIKESNIIKAWEYCCSDTEHHCSECILHPLNNAQCVNKRYLSDALDLFNRQKTELKRLKDGLKYYLDTHEEKGVVYIPKFVMQNFVKEMVSE